MKDLPTLSESKELGREDLAPKGPPKVREHIWEYRRRIQSGPGDTGFYLWECKRCGSETFTSDKCRTSPSLQDMINSCTYSDCDLAMVAVITNENKIQQYDLWPEMDTE
jgi:hypothetical protein